MLVNLSAAVTADGYMDDNTPERLTISTPEDMAEVYRLRTGHDAILVGAETLRRANPALLLRDPEARRRRAERGLRPDLTKVTVTASGKLDPSLRFFTEGDAEHYVFSTVRLPELDRVATVIRSDAPSATSPSWRNAVSGGFSSRAAHASCVSFSKREWPTPCGWPSIRP